MTSVPNLLTPGRIAEELGATLKQVQYILATRPHIRPSARAGIIRLYSRESLEQVRRELEAIEARHHESSGAVSYA